MNRTAGFVLPDETISINEIPVIDNGNAERENNVAYIVIVL